MPLINNALAIQDQLVGFIIPQSYYSVKSKENANHNPEFYLAKKEIIWLNGSFKMRRRNGNAEQEFQESRKRSFSPCNI